MPTSTLPERLAEAVAIAHLNDQLLRLQHLANPIHTGKQYVRSRTERRELFLAICQQAEKAAEQLAGYASVAVRRKRTVKPATTLPTEPATTAAA